MTHPLRMVEACLIIPAVNKSHSRTAYHVHAFLGFLIDHEQTVIARV